MATDVKLSSEFTIIYGGEVIAYATDFTLERAKEVIDITKLGDTWKNKKTSIKDFSVSFNAMVTRGDTITSSLWNATTAYSSGDYVVLAGNAYEAQGSTTGDNPTTDDGSNWIETSDYAAGTTYAAGDMVYLQTVTDEKRIYISLVGSNVGNSPPDSATQWERLETNYESLLKELKNNDTAVKVTIKPSSTDETYYIGEGVLTSLSASIGVSDKVTFSGSLEGSGALTGGVSLGSELIINGDMELDANWTGYNLEGAETVERSSEQAHTGTYSWKVYVDDGNEGITSDLFSVVSGTNYKFGAWLYAAVETTVKIVSNNVTRLPLSETVTATVGWSYHTFDCLSAESNQAQVRFLSVGLPLEFYVDDVSLKPYL